jgi:hypothetical protein
MPQGKNRYPGIRSFEPDDQRLFYGRSNEIDQLYNLIKIKPMIVLFGKSGLGKTSLLKAGVGPLLVKQSYYPVLIRLQDVGVAPSVSVLNELEQFVDSDLLNKFGNKSKNKIWETLKAASFKTADGKPATPILIFDQFEELFSHNKDVQEEFTAFVGDLTENRLPADIADALNQVPRSERTKELMEWFRPPDVKTIFAIRSDRMSELHSLRHDIPAILQNRFELKPLKSHQAKEAVEKPAALEGEEFLTAPFSYAPETIEKIQTELSNEFGEIESFQLQIICQYVERKVKKEQTDGNQNVVVTPDYLGEAEGIREILKNYYNTQVSMLGSDEEQMAARKLLEEGLIVNKRRVGVAEAVVKESFNISDELLGKLLTSRLIRPEDTRLGRTYEISHDTLVKPILQAYEKRRIKEERLAAIEEQKQLRLVEEQERIQKERKLKIIRLTTVITLLSIFATVAGFGWYYAFRDGNVAKKVNEELTAARDSLELKQIALQNEQIALSEAKDSLERQNENLLASVSALIQVAGITFEDAIKKIEKNAKERSAISKNLLSEKESVREKATNDILRKYKNDPKMIAVLLESLKGKISEDYKNNIYQAIYVLENSSPKALQANKTELETFISSVLKAKTSDGIDLAGTSTKIKLNRIENKLK